MSVTTTPTLTSIDRLNLDPSNPLLGRHRMQPNTPQEKLLEWMAAWKLDELAFSYLESGGLWSHEPLIVVAEPLYRQKKALVVVEGNRRLAALNYLKNAIDGHPASPKWESMVNDFVIPKRLFTDIPYVLADTRDDVQAFLGFRHVTGIKQWDADEKAGFIVQMVDGNDLSYDQVARKIGSTAPAVRRHYIAFHVLLQIEENVPEFPREAAERRFAVLYDSIQKAGVQAYLGLDLNAEPMAARTPVHKKRLRQLAHFSRWIYGTMTTEPLLTDTRLISDFGKILDSEKAIAYLEGTSAPSFEVAFQLAGGDESEHVRLISSACEQIEEALRTIHLFKTSQDLQKVVRRLGADSSRLLSTFPSIQKQLSKEEQE